MLRQFLEWLESGSKTPTELLYMCLRQILGAEREVRAWVEVAAQDFVEGRPLSGIPYGAKDIFETIGMATEYGSPLYEGRKGEFDADVVIGLRQAGAVLLGKTHTAAFASFDPAPTRNPRLPGHTPGGSSSGSAAAVAAGMVPFAIGTQTLGSVLRPASYCGICGFKPTFGRVSTHGILRFAPSLDTVGFFTQTAADMAALWSRSFGGPSTARLRRAARMHTEADASMEQAVGEAVGRWRAGGVVIEEIDPPAGWVDLCGAALRINGYEGARSHRERWEGHGERLGARLAELVRSGLQMPEAEYRAALDVVTRMRPAMAALFREYQAILTPAATGPAPEGLSSTGDPAANAPWTALGVPTISIPLAVEGAPLGLQLAAGWGEDDALIAMTENAGTGSTFPGF